MLTSKMFLHEMIFTKSIHQESLLLLITFLTCSTLTDKVRSITDVFSENYLVDEYHGFCRQTIIILRDVLQEKPIRQKLAVYYLNFQNKLKNKRYTKSLIVVNFIICINKPLSKLVDFLSSQSLEKDLYRSIMNKIWKHPLYQRLC